MRWCRFGSLYRRVVERLIAPDTTRQASGCGVTDPGPSFHPWFPVLESAGNKADLYMRALVADIVHKHRNLSDPSWLLQIGLYLEFLTFLGVVEAVRDDVGDLLTPAERSALATSPRCQREICSPSDVRRWLFPRLTTRTSSMRSSSLDRTPQRTGDLAESLPRCRTGGPSDDARGVPGARVPAVTGA